MSLTDPKLKTFLFIGKPCQQSTAELTSCHISPLTVWATESTASFLHRPGGSFLLAEGASDTGSQWAVLKTEPRLTGVRISSGRHNRSVGQDKIPLKDSGVFFVHFRSKLFQNHTRVFIVVISQKDTKQQYFQFPNVYFSKRNLIKIADWKPLYSLDEIEVMYRDDEK